MREKVDIYFKLVFAMDEDANVVEEKATSPKDQVVDAEETAAGKEVKAEQDVAEEEKEEEEGKGNELHAEESAPSEDTSAKEEPAETPKGRTAQVMQEAFQRQDTDESVLSVDSVQDTPDDDDNNNDEEASVKSSPSQSSPPQRARRSLRKSVFYPASKYDELKGYLRKKSKTGRWQKRWFEANDHYLTYYKTAESEKLLACIDVRQVTAIEFAAPGEDVAPGEFYIQLGQKKYPMKSKSREAAERWVTNLKARRQGGLKDGAEPIPMRTSSSKNVEKIDEEEEKGSEVRADEAADIAPPSKVLSDASAMSEEEIAAASPLPPPPVPEIDFSTRHLSISKEPTPEKVEKTAADDFDDVDLNEEGDKHAQATPSAPEVEAASSERIAHSRCACCIVS